MKDLSVRIWEEEVMIPTYETGQPDKNPMFFEKRVYQGSSGTVYPYPIVEKIYDEKHDKLYNAVFLENHFLKIMILPQLGGRVQMAYDKIAERHFVYYNEVIKPALVGLCGPWISGGIEFNWPQHHRPSTFSVVEHMLKDNEDGSKTVWINEIDKMYRTKGMTGFTLYPDKAYLEVSARLFNRTPLPQTFLWWANPALKANDHYQSVFPPDVNAVVDHGRRDVSSFPIATGAYYKVDYAPGTDISRYHNIPVPTSYMVHRSDFDFVGGYHHDEQAGFLHVANHHISPGKKQWTWGNSDFGKAWERNLTDNNGPYIELMAGVYTDNQPDFAWMMPFEEKRFSQYFMPYRQLGVIKNASKDLLLQVSVTEDTACLKLFSTGINDTVEIKVISADTEIFNSSAQLEAGEMFTDSFVVNSDETTGSYKIIIRNSKQELVLTHQEPVDCVKELPEAASAPLPPEEMKNADDLVITGMHLEQYRHATLSPLLYYEEALRRNENDMRANNAMGTWFLRRGCFAESERYLRKAINILTQKNGNPYEGEIFHNLALAMEYLERPDEAYTFYYKATWSGSLQSAAYCALARIDLQRNHLSTALEHIDRCLRSNPGNGKAWVFKSIVLRKLNRLEDAISTCKHGLEQDGFNLALYFEISKGFSQSGAAQHVAHYIDLLYRYAGVQPQNFIEYSIDFSQAGQYKEAIEWLNLYHKKFGADPMIFYYLGYNHHKVHNTELAASSFDLAAGASTNYCFPNRLEDIAILETALKYNPQDDHAYFYLGCLWYDKKQYGKAIECWQNALNNNPCFGMAHRTLGIALFNKQKDAVKAKYHFEKAFELNNQDARLLMELNQLYKRLNYPLSERLSILEKNNLLTDSRDDLYLERITIYNLTGNYKKALQLIRERRFHPWEGGEGKVCEQYKYSLIGLARLSIMNKNFGKAIKHLEELKEYPDNLGEGKMFESPENDRHYWLGMAYEGLYNSGKSFEHFKQASIDLKPASALLAPDLICHQRFYQGLALQKLNHHEKARTIFNNFIQDGMIHLHDDIAIDYFAVSLPDMMVFDDNLNLVNSIYCKYLVALGQLGLHQEEKAGISFDEILETNTSHPGANFYARMLKSPIGGDQEVI
jgi:tetratricopeptide (TPR) repeat protein